MIFFCYVIRFPPRFLSQLSETLGLWDRLGLQTFESELFVRFWIAFNSSHFDISITVCSFNVLSNFFFVSVFSDPLMSSLTGLALLVNIQILKIVESRNLQNQFLSSPQRTSSMKAMWFLYLLGQEFYLFVVFYLMLVDLRLKVLFGLIDFDQIVRGWCLEMVSFCSCRLVSTQLMVPLHPILKFIFLYSLH